MHYSSTIEIARWKILAFLYMEREDTENHSSKNPYTNTDVAKLGTLVRV